jgi:hypothetical protein
MKLPKSFFSLNCHLHLIGKAQDKVTNPQQPPNTQGSNSHPSSMKNFNQYKDTTNTYIIKKTRVAQAAAQTPQQPPALPSKPAIKGKILNKNYKFYRKLIFI